MNHRARTALPPRLAGEVGLGLAFVAALAVQAVAVATSWGVTYWWFDVVAGAVVCAIALARRWHPGWAAGIGLTVAAAALVIAWLAHLPAEPGLAMTMALSVLIGSAVRALAPAAAGVLAAGGLVVVLGSVLVAAVSDSGSAVPVLSAVGWLSGVAGGIFLRFLGARRQAVVAAVRRAERLDLSRELHDIAAHHLTGIVVEAQAARLDARKHADPERMVGSFAGIEAAGSEALAAIRRVVGLLRGAEHEAPARRGLEGLTELVERFNGRVPSLRLHLPDPLPEWPPEVTGALHRVVQEALTNIVRHAAHAGEVRVTLTDVGGVVTVEVTDDASARPARISRGYGLVGMRERVEALGGTLTSGPRAEAGWSVVATLPLPQGERL